MSFLGAVGGLMSTTIVFAYPTIICIKLSDEKLFSRDNIINLVIGVTITIAGYTGGILSTMN
jgi:hypothetical protein